jgi:hypothetical protein
LSLRGEKLCCKADCLITDWTDEGVDLWRQIFVL